MKWIGQITYDETSYFREDVIIEAGNKLGIGTNSPAYPLDVNGDVRFSDTSENVRLYLTSNNAYNSIIYFGDENNGTIARLQYKNSDNSFGFYTNSGERMRITSAGDVGIGTTSPSAKLEIVGDWVSNYGSINISHSSNTLGGLGLRANNVYKGGLIYRDGTAGAYWELTAYAAEPILFKTSNTEKMRITSAGLVGIGTSSPDTLLHVEKNGYDVTTATFSIIPGGGITGNDKYQNLDFEHYSYTSNPHTLNRIRSTMRSGWGGEMSFWTMQASDDTLKERMTILESGNVGIGVTAPASKLHVAGTVQVGVDDTGHDVKFYGDTAGKYMLWDTSTDDLLLTDGTYAKYGTSSDLTIGHTGSESIIDHGGTGDLVIRQSTADKDIIFESDDGSGGETAYLTLDGSVVKTVFAKHTSHKDSVSAYFGTGLDF